MISQQQLSRTRIIVRDVVGFLWLIGMIGLSLVGFLGFRSVELIAIGIAWAGFGFWWHKIHLPPGPSISRKCIQNEDGEWVYEDTGEAALCASCKKPVGESSENHKCE